MKAKLAQGLASMGIYLPMGAAEKLLAYLALLEKWNGSYNLTSPRALESAISRHLFDSLSILPCIGENAYDRVLDVGSGGGMPGIPLAIALPGRTVTLVESASKKAAFLRQAAIELDLTNISVHGGRIEQYHPSFGFSLIVSRAFSTLRDFVMCSRHLLAEGGRWIAMKGLWPQEELDALPGGVELEAARRLHVPDIEGERHLVILKADGTKRREKLRSGV